ncbi:outer membrane protein [Magnetospirillum sulfuroxidans]|uniref:Porin family protein n=1 Tax=Magnetospirillum sulfuroxidans TaxID=611300 RepID=A0ABS5I9Z5_9PROT|nr:outer membrane beta-barrel protein [Magnetospirillum sulfuroxidans]MBR9970568.1 porin family protein [Magnetospirillum sulfuroxidans]
MRQLVFSLSVLGKASFALCRGHVMLRSIVTPLILCSLPALAFAGQAVPAKPNPDKGWYFSGKGGPSFSTLQGVTASQSGAQAREDSSANVVGAFGMAGGYEWSYRYRIPLRTELEFMNRTEVTYDASPLRTSQNSGALASTVQNVTTMAKGYWHFPVGSSAWWPFVSAGLGWAHNTAKSQYTPSGSGMSKHSQSNDDLAWSVGAGATFKLGPDVMNDIELRYVDLGKVNWGLPAENIEANGFGAFSATEVVFSLRYMF